MLDPTHLHYVYRYFDEDNELLYVGESNDPRRRAQDHANSKEWWPDVTYTSVEAFNNMSLAKTEEVRAIRDELPRYNVVGRPQWFVRGQRADDREQRRREWWAENRPGEQPHPRERARSTRPRRRPRKRREVITMPVYVFYRLFIQLPVLMVLYGPWPTVKWVMQRHVFRLRLCLPDEVHVEPENWAWVADRVETFKRREIRRDMRRLHRGVQVAGRVATQSAAQRDAYRRASEVMAS